MKLTNNDKLRSLQYLTTIMNPDFRMWYVSTTQKEVDLSNMNKISPTFVKAVKQYINLTEFILVILFKIIILQEQLYLERFS